MIEELDEILEEYGESLDCQYQHPAAKWLFTTKLDAKPLEEQKADVYLSFVAKVLWVEKYQDQILNPLFLSSVLKSNF